MGSGVGATELGQKQGKFEGRETRGSRTKGFTYVAIERYRINKGIDLLHGNFYHFTKENICALFVLFMVKYFFFLIKWTYLDKTLQGPPILWPVTIYPVSPHL